MDIWNWTSDERMSFLKGVGEVLLSFICFFALSFAVRWYLFGRCTFRTFSYFNFPRSIRNQTEQERDSKSLQNVPPNKKWRITNELVSLVHSVVSGSWALYCLLIVQTLIEDMIYYNDERPKLLLFVTTGYLLHDLVDLLINERSIRILELLFHHIIVLGAFSIYYFTGQFLGVVICGLLMELNSIFLHSRSLMNLYGVPKKSTAFRVVALLNISTFMVFRMAVSGYLVYWQVTNAWTMAWYITLVTFVVIFSLATTNTILCYRVMAADGLLGKKRRRTRTNGQPNKEDDADDEDEEEEEEDTDEDVERGRQLDDAATTTNGTSLLAVRDDHNGQSDDVRT